MLFGSGGGQVIALALAPALTRLYGPDAFGSFGLFIAVTTLAAPIASLGLEAAIVLERDEAGAREAYGFCLVLAAVIAAATGLAALLLARSAWLPGFTPAVSALVAPSVLALGVGQVLTGRALALGRPGAIASGRLARSAGVGVSQLALGMMLGVGAVPLVVGAVIGQAIAVAATWRGLRGTAGPRLSRAGLTRLMIRHRALWRWSAPQSLLNNAGNAALPLILGRVAGDASVGAYTLANRVVLLPAITIGEAVRQSLLTTMSPIAHDAAALRRLALRVTCWLGLGLGAATAIGFIVAPSLFAWLFGEHWRQAGSDAALLLAAQAAGIANSPAVTVVTVRGLQRGFFLFQAVTMPLRLVAVAVAASGGHAFSALAVHASLSVLASAAVSTGIFHHLASSARDRSVPEGQPA